MVYDLQTASPSSKPGQLNRIPENGLPENSNVENDYTPSILNKPACYFLQLEDNQDESIPSWQPLISIQKG